jgi:hypothetical protein
VGVRISVMQPYFAPYAGYFRLMCDVDAFVVLDKVQFPRGGWVHRNRLRRLDGVLDWLTLPLANAPLSATILDLSFAPDVEAWTRKGARRFGALHQPAPQVQGLLPLIEAAERPCGCLIRLVGRFAATLGIVAPLVRQSELPLPAGLKGPDRIYEICRRLGADRYLNSPGGRELYQHDAFRRRGIELEFLPDYRGPAESILQRLQETPAHEIAAEIRANL